ncbi:phosphoglycerate mutase-like protein [Cladorrhinum sp. PSN259]|nr:phosphoglycerate mutase-like protein [Cladorrhinum sp. PSN259]
MPQTVLFIRHAQALHNTNSEFKKTLDPELTEEGKEQCIKLRDHLKEKLKDTKVDLIIVSPMQRALQTAMIGLDWLIEEQKVPVEANALWQEIYDKPCDTGRPIPVLSQQFPLVDFSKVDPVWPDKTSIRARLYRPTKTEVLARAEMAKEDLQRRPERFIIVVSHSGFMRKGLVGRCFANADYRIFSLTENEGFTEHGGMERGGMGRSEGEHVEIGSGLYDDELAT